jgi:protein-disulfide isomerase
MATQVKTPRPVLTVPVSARDHVRGPATAAVTLVEYGDYQCPSCQEAHPIVTDVRHYLGDRMRLVFRNFPLTALHHDAQAAAEAAEAAGAQGKFWEMHDYLFGHQSRLDRAALLGYAAAIGLDVARFTRDLDGREFAGRVREDIVSGVRSGVNATPTFFINSVRHDDRWDLETLATALLAAAEES